MKLEVLASATHASRSHPIVFVHGAWHAAWCWEQFQPYLAQQGYASYAISLRGHGQSEGRQAIRRHSAADYVADLAQLVQGIATPPILVGHSMGGYVVQKYLEIYSAPAAVLLASLPVSGILGFGLRFVLRHPAVFLKAHLTMNPWHFVATPALAHEALFSPELPAAEVSRHFARLQPESFRLELDAMLLNLPQPKRVTTPMLVLAAERDRVFSVREQQATARAYGTTAEVFSGMAHDMMLEPNWRQVADRIVRWLGERGL